MILTLRTLLRSIEHLQLAIVRVKALVRGRIRSIILAPMRIHQDKWIHGRLKQRWRKPSRIPENVKGTSVNSLQYPLEKACIRSQWSMYCQIHREDKTLPKQWDKIPKEWIKCKKVWVVEVTWVDIAIVLCHLMAILHSVKTHSGRNIDETWKLPLSAQISSSWLSQVLPLSIKAK